MPSVKNISVCDNGLELPWSWVKRKRKREGTIMADPQSKALHERALKHIPGGVNSPVRAFRAVGGEPVYIARGEGPYIWGVDGTRYVDYVGSWGPMILGHAHPTVVKAICDAAMMGTSFGAPTEREVLFAELLCSAIPSLEMVRLCSSGTEADLQAATRW
jgi:glutamate-1-semialdehyde 2,1-aminomutase